ncbi:hypothetical protein [Haladaptatus sp. DYSN1]|uniref:hypothetical protein n=1 Tax=unclassified Haladaptatus TaxID=2622732 RepID=UPI002404DDD3|nr:hypothetical protein [Haladaptatus sp. DYSN1]
MSLRIGCLSCPMAPSPHSVDPEPLRKRLLRFYAHESGDHTISDVPDHSAAYLELPKFELARRGHDPPPVDESNIKATLSVVERRADCADFGLNALLRFLYRYADSPRLSPALRTAIQEAVCGFVYWFDDAATEMWFSTENHQILFHTAELLAGQLFPDTTFAVTGKPGSWHRERARTAIDRWLEWRARFGFSEWLSNAYYDEDLVALANLAVFAADSALRERSRTLIDLTLFDVACNSHRGVFGSTHGRTYARYVLDPLREPTSALQYLCWGAGTVEQSLSLAAVALASDDYRVPPVVQEAALTPRVETRERHSLDVEDATAYGLDPDSREDQLFFWGALAMGHRDVVDAALARVSPTYEKRLPEISGAAAYHETFANHPDYDPDPNNTAMTQADVYTSRRPEYMLSCAQDFRKGKFGFQQHVWQATLAGRAPVFANHPKGPLESVGPDGYWCGNGLHPRAAAYENVLCCLFRVGTPPHPVPDIPGFDASFAETSYTHAFVPRYAFDEFVSGDDWQFGRADDGYVAIAATTPTRWRDPDPAVTDLLPIDAGATNEPYELVADGTETAWLCELGSATEHGSFDEFVEAITGSSVAGSGTNVTYESPTVGTVEFSWDGPLTVDGREIELADYPRIDNRFCTTEFGETRDELRGETTTTLDFGE